MKIITCSYYFVFADHRASQKINNKGFSCLNHWLWIRFSGQNYEMWTIIYVQELPKSKITLENTESNSTMMKYGLNMFIFLLVVNNTHHYNVIRKDPFAILAETLKTNQRAACDGDSLQMECPIGTKVYIQKRSFS